MDAPLAHLVGAEKMKLLPSRTAVLSARACHAYRSFVMPSSSRYTAHTSAALISEICGHCSWLRICCMWGRGCCVNICRLEAAAGRLKLSPENRPWAAA
jgi:hypothetical protein